ncbi:hypothetical protein QR77_10175 [Streptomyces sp. 150FB]|nr:hypothetical protein QR77_10175 [Streptomyces sp. 150FB]
MTTVRRCAAVFAATAVLCVAFVPAAAAGGDVPFVPGSTPEPSPATPSLGGPSPTPSPAPPPSVVIPKGLYGTGDPEYDGVWRQSLAMLGQFAAGIRPANQAIAWLKAQQCANGAFPAYRAETRTPCDAQTAVDSNSTAAAVEALSTIGAQRPAMQKSLSWLKSVQNADGGWSYTPGTPSDANSTSLVIGALTVAGLRPSAMKSSAGKNAYDALVDFSLPCDVKTGAAKAADGGDAGGAPGGAPGGGAFAYQPDKAGKLTANNDATAAAVLGGLGKRMVTAPVQAGPAPKCLPNKGRTPERAARNGAAYLADALAKTGHLDQPPLPGAASGKPLPDPGNTAAAVVALTSAGYGTKATGALAWLKQNAVPWAEQNGPAAYAQLILACHATDSDPHHFGGVDLVQRLNAQGPAPTVVPTPTPSGPSPTAPTPNPTGPRAAIVSADADNGSSTTLWLIGVVLVAVIGGGVLFVTLRKSRRP